MRPCTTCGKSAHYRVEKIVPGGLYGLRTSDFLCVDHACAKARTSREALTMWPLPQAVAAASQRREPTGEQLAWAL